MTRVAFLCLAVLAAAPARAYDAPSKEDVGAVAACLTLVRENQKKAGVEKEETPGPAGRLAAAARSAPLDPTSCVGVLVTACTQKEGTSNGAQSGCAEREGAVWDQRLNAAYRRALDHMEKEGADNLRKTQRAWIALRDVRCQQAWAAYHGSMAGPIQAWCEMELTARQALWVDSWSE
ncbi:lysozyme inhibitor LprI family protein [Methylocystis sp. IM3]|uniref:lysozyme inhibitor LprI family protein n=1 Tax=unclassified Methylocystis TaxID=2625913 RepID=UPI0030F8C0D3